MKKHTDKKNILRILIGIGTVAVLAFLTWQLFGDMLPDIIRLIKNGDQAAIAAYIEKQGAWRGLLSIFLLSIIQVISVVIPGIIIQFTGGMIFPWWEAFIAAYSGFVLANVLVFSFAKAFRHQVHADQKKAGWIISTVNKYDPAFVFALACLVPGIPNGVIPYFAAAAKLSVREYAASVAISSWIQILSNCLAGHFLIRKQFVFTVLSFVAQIAIIFIAGANRKKILEKFGRPDPKAKLQKEQQAEESASQKKQPTAE